MTADEARLLYAYNRWANERVLQAVAAAGIAISTAFDDRAMKMVALSVAGFGMFASLPVFWTLPPALLSGAAAAGSIAMINSIGNLAGFAGPYAIGWIKD